MADPDYATWLTKQQAAEAIGVTTKTVERFVQEGKIQQTRWQRPSGGPKLAVYQPDDVARVAQERHPGPLPPFLVPATAGPVNGNGQASDRELARVPAPGLSRIPDTATGDELLRVLVTAAVKVMSQTSETPTVFVTLADASAVTGLSQAYLKRKVADGTLKAIRDRGWRIRRKDLEGL